MKNIIRFISAIVILAAIGLNFAQAAGDKIVKSPGTIQESVSADGITQMVIFENDFDRLLQDAIANGQLEGFLKSASVKIFDGFVEVTAITQKPMTATLFVRAKIAAKNKKLYPELLNVRYGFFPIPNSSVKFLISKLAGQDFRNFQNTGIETPGMEWQSVDFKKGKATIKFKEVK